MNDFMMEREIQEALTAGENALQSLYAASEQLDSARNWGIIVYWEAVFYRFIKHSKREKQRSIFHRQDIIFNSSKKNCVMSQQMIQYSYRRDDFLSFADFFFDGVVADYLVQSRINETRRKVAEAIRRVEELTAKLRAKYS